MDTTHHVAAGALVFNRRRLLLLKRTTEPKVWAPPGGRLHLREDPIEGLKRECLEETSLTIRVWELHGFRPTITWFGKHQVVDTIVIFYIAETRGGTIQLSDEHMSAGWYGIDDIPQLTLREEVFGTKEFYFRGFDLYNLWTGKIANSLRH